MRRPRPLRSVVWLPSAGLDERRATRHVFVETLPCTLKDGSRGWEFVYACEETGVKRRFWYEPRVEMLASEAN